MRSRAVRVWQTILMLVSPDAKPSSATTVLALNALVEPGGLTAGAYLPIIRAKHATPCTFAPVTRYLDVTLLVNAIGICCDRPALGAFGNGARLLLSRH
jgi:hypothetical protein